MSDIKNKNFCHTHLHTHKGSLLDGLGRSEEYAKRAKEMKFQYLAITDHSSIDETINFQKQCLKNEIISIIGCELYLVASGDFKGKSGHVCVHVKNETGWKNLLKMLSIANLKHFYKRPRIDFDILYEFCEGLTVETACAGSFLNLEGSKEFFLKLHHKMKEDLYLELQPHHLDVQDLINKKCLDLNKETGVKLISSTDLHYCFKEDKYAHDILLCIQRNQLMSDPKRFRFDFDTSYLQSWDEILENYRTRGVVDEKTAKKSLFNTLEIAEKCRDFRIKEQSISLPDFRPFPELSPKENLKKLYEDKFEERLGFKLEDNQVYKDRLEMEYKVITEKDFESYFLIVQDVVNWMRSSNIVTSPGRGSAAGSLLSYVLGITEVDPIVHGLIFERFLNPERNEMPDIDIDVPRHERERVRQYIIDKYGENCVAGVSTFMYLKGKSVIRDVARVFSIPMEEVDVFAKSLEDKGEDIVKRGSEETAEGQAFTKKYPKIVEYAIRLEGTVKSAGQHPSALILSRNDLTKSGQCNLSKRSGHIVVNWDMHDAETSGLMKLDLLGLSQLSIIGESFNLIEEIENKKYSISDFKALDDQKVFDNLSAGNTAGIFQMNTSTMTDYIKKLGISNFQDMSACLALVRPGAMDSGIADEYIERKNGKIWEPKHEIYERITNETLGLAPYQENVMMMFTQMAGLSFSIADKIRKIIGKKRDVREFDQYKDMFVEGCLKQKTFTKDEANQFWSELEASANYLFNKSHSVSYAYLSYVTAWLKINYPSYFFCANLTMGEDNKKDDVVKEAYNAGLQIKLPKVGYSKAEKWTVKDGVLLAPFSEIDGLGEKAAKAAEDEVIPLFKPFKGFYKSKERDEKETKLKFLFNTIKAYDFDAKPELDMQPLFKFPISNDLDVIAPGLLDMCRDNYHPEYIKKVYNGQKYLSMSLIQPVEKPNYVFECLGCSLNSKPFKTQFGEKNIMIITEHPSYTDANQTNKLFSCNIANEVLMDLYNMGIPYEDLTIGACCKCSPGKGKKPIDEHKRSCFGNLEKEIKVAQPKFILSLGRISFEFFHGAEDRASNYYSKFEWNEYYQSFVFYGYSLGYAYMGAENKAKFKKSIKKFYEMLRRNK